MRRCAWSLVGLLISVRVAEDGSCESTPAPTAQPTTSMTLAPTSPYGYAPAADATPYCRLQSQSVCWGNMRRFLEVEANGPFEGLDFELDDDWTMGLAFADLDGDGTLRLRPLSIERLRPHILCRSQVTWTS